MARLVIEGPAGHANQPDDPVWASYVDALGMVIDEWVIRERHDDGFKPEFGPPMHMSVIGYTRRDDEHHKPCYAVALYTVDATSADLMRAFRIPRALAASLLFIEPVEVQSAQMARKVGHNLAHNAVRGMVPVYPCTEEQVAAWQSSIRVLALATTVDGSLTLPPLDVTHSAS